MPDSKPQNGFCEVTIREIGRIQDSIVKRSGMEAFPRAWPYYVRHAINIHNHRPRKRKDGSFRSNAEVWYGRTMETFEKLFLPFGCYVIPMHPKDQKRRYGSKTYEGIYFGIAEGYKGVVILDIKAGKFRIARSLKADVSYFPFVDKIDIHKSLKDIIVKYLSLIHI